MAKLACAGCGGLLDIGPDVDTFACAKCGVTQRVTRQGGIVALTRLDTQSQPTASAMPRAAPVAAQKPKTARAQWIVVGVVGAALVAFFAIPERERVANEGGARYMCRKLMEERLNDPGSAEWIDKYKWPASQTAPQEFIVQMHYRAKNGFGGLITKHSKCKVRSDTSTGIGNWKLLELSEF